MPFAEWREFWWSSVTGPRTLVNRVADCLLEKNMVVLIVPDDLPWRHEMRNIIETIFKQKAFASNIMIHQIDAIDDFPPKAEPGRYLLERFAPTEIFKAYREKSGITLQKYMLNNAVLKDTIVWIKGLETSQAGDWIKFCKEYAPPTIEDGLVILEMRGDGAIADMRRVKVIRLADYVSRYDLQLFNSFILDDTSIYTATWKSYASTIAARLCNIDAEVSEKMINITNFKSEEPLSGIRQIAELPEFELRGQDDGRHILACYRAGDVSEIHKRIWAAQVQILFPLIEFERMNIVSTLSREIQTLLETHTILQYNRRLTDPLDMELGTLVYHFSHKSDGDNYYIYIPDETLRNRIRFLHECRNLLAHADCLTVQQVFNLIEGVLISHETG